MLMLLVLAASQRTLHERSSYEQFVHVLTIPPIYHKAIQMQLVRIGVAWYLGSEIPSGTRHDLNQYVETSFWSKIYPKYAIFIRRSQNVILAHAGYREP